MERPEIKKALSEIGLSEGEIRVYLALLKLGSVQVSKIKEETRLHRTTIYDFVEKLLNKGLINYVIRNNVKYYNATHPNKLLDFIMEKEESIKEILPQLAALSETKKEEIKVEVYKGVEGFKAVLSDIIRVGEDMVGFGIDEAKFKEKFPILMEQYFKKELEKGIKERLLASEKTKFLFRKKTAKYRFIPNEFFNPTPTAVYGNKIAFIVWEPLTVVMIENSELADSYKKYFEMLWNGAKEKRSQPLIKSIKSKV